MLDYRERECLVYLFYTSIDTQHPEVSPRLVLFQTIRGKVVMYLGKARLVTRFRI